MVEFVVAHRPEVGAIARGVKVLVVDNLLATGGNAGGQNPARRGDAPPAASWGEAARCWVVVEPAALGSRALQGQVGKHLTALVTIGDML